MRAAKRAETQVAAAIAGNPRVQHHVPAPVDDDAWFWDPDSRASLVAVLYDKPGYLPFIAWLLSETTLHAALPETVRFLLSSALLSAATMGSAEVVETILSSAFFRERIVVATPAVYSQLLQAASLNDTLLRLVVAHGVDVNAPVAPDGWAQESRAVMWAALVCVDNVEDLVREGAFTVLEEPLPVTLLERCEPGDVSTLHRLGFDLNQVGLDPAHGLLHEAMLESNVALAEEILRLGTTDVDLRDASGRTPLMIAAQGTEWEWEESSEDGYVAKSCGSRAAKNVALLLEWSPDIHASDADGCTALDHALQLGHTEAADLLRNRT
ncbi:hypothetical protein PINS_up009723 [Pythium insidiosum]|nr:hypothetical protein PINS_up009723 [Pythium insidiosum]